MKHTIPYMALASLAILTSCQQPVSTQRGNLVLSDEETYGYLNCHMSDRGQWTTYALSQDGLHFHDLLCGDSIFSPTEMAGNEGGTRDAYICRKKDDSGFLMVTTDMNNSATKRLGKNESSDRYLIHSYIQCPDLLNQTIGMKNITEIFCQFNKNQ